MDYTLSQANIYSKYNTNKYLGSLGLCVNREYRGCGIAKELLKARKQIMENMGLIVSVTVFSAKGSQQAARSVGFEEIFAIR
jgi:GNAT superfamily N-acetyltransferase